MLGDEQGPLIGLYLDRVLDDPKDVRASISAILRGRTDGWRTETGLATRPGTRVEHRRLAVV